MKKIIKIVLIIVLIIIGLRALVILNYFFSLKDKDQKDLLIEAIGEEIKVFELDTRCHQIDYYKSDEFDCLKTKSENCNLNKMNLQKLKDISQRLEEATQRCVDTFVK